MSIRRAIHHAAALAVAASLLAGCAATPSRVDPFEPMNRAFYEFHDAVDTAVIRPVVHGYTEVIPQPIRQMVSNFFNNIEDVISAANDLLQGDWDRLGTALGKLNEAPILIDETPSLNPLELRARSRRKAREYGGLGLIVVDYIQLMQAAETGTENRATELSEISRGLKSMAKELKVPVIALSQLNRSLEQRPNKRPVMSDLRESGALEQDADMIFFIYRDEVYNEESPDKGMAEIIIGKQRNGPIGTIKLTFLGKHTRFENYSGASGY